MIQLIEDLAIIIGRECHIPITAREIVVVIIGIHTTNPIIAVAPPRGTPGVQCLAIMVIMVTTKIIIAGMEPAAGLKSQQTALNVKSVLLKFLLFVKCQMRHYKSQVKESGRQIKFVNKHWES